MKAADMPNPALPDPIPLRRNSHARLHDLLEEMSERPEAEAEITATIERDFGETRAVLVLDMSGFSRCTQQNGIVCFLLMIHEMKRLAVPAVEEAGGILVKAEADNLYCLFEDVDAAIGAAREILRRLARANAGTAQDRHLGAAIGIGFGRVLNVDERDLFGHEVNLACKLGEDIAKEGEILLTLAANQRALACGFETERREGDVSNVMFSYFRLA
jgi:class 3 adenylate cyclase